MTSQDGHSAPTAAAAPAQGAVSGRSRSGGAGRGAGVQGCQVPAAVGSRGSVLSWEGLICKNRQTEGKGAHPQPPANKEAGRGPLPFLDPGMWDTQA